jgi:hypothetical protein
MNDEGKNYKLTDWLKRRKTTVYEEHNAEECILIQETKP